MTNISFYHSVICPRCFIAGRYLDSMLHEFPDVAIQKVEILTNGARARADGVSTIPSLVAGNQKLSGFYLTKGAIRRFLQSL